ncbi:MAG: polysaccharide deacetylase family protein [Vicinamibacterales bacterium]
MRILIGDWMLNLVVPIVFGLALLQAPQPTRRVAITIDDGPVVGEMSDLARFQRISAGLIGSLTAERVPATIFVNERQLNVPGQRDARAAVLDQWLDAGFDLANHTYSHPSVNKVPLWQFADDVMKGEVIMRQLVERRGKKFEWFRYPFLHSGMSEDVHQGIVDFLAQRGYRVAPVTVDYADYTFAGVFRNQLAAGNTGLAEKIKDAYLDQVDVGFEYAEKTSVEVFGHEIPQILLIHCNELNSLTLRDTIARLRKRGYTFITLDEAMKDAAYERPDTFAGSGGSWLSRSATVLGKKLTLPRPAVPDWITSTLTSGTVQARPGLAFREDWKDTPAATPVTQDHVANPDLVVTLHGPGREQIKKSHHDQPADDPYYVWSGDTKAPWAVSLRPRRGPIDLSGPARIRWRAKQSGFHELHLIVQIADQQWLVSDQADGPSADWREREFAIADLTWRTLDISAITEGRPVEKPNLSRVIAIGVTDLRAGGGTPASSRLDWIEVYGK